MNSARAAIAVGIFVVVGVVLIIVGVAWTQRGIGSGKDTYTLFGQFDDVTGIATGTKVTVAGYTVGRVETLELHGTHVKVTVRLQKSVTVWSGHKDADGALKSGAVLQRLQASMLGDYYLELSPGATGKKLAEGEQIPTVITATALQQTIERLQSAGNIIPKIDKIADNVVLITDKAAKVFGSDTGERKLEDIANNLVAASKDLQETAAALRGRLSTGVFAKGGDLDRGLRAFAETAEKLDGLTDRADNILAQGGNTALRSLDNIEVLTRNVREMVGENQGNSTINQVKQTLEQLKESLSKASGILDDLGKAAKNVNQVTQDVADGKGNVGRLLKDETLIHNAETAVQDAKDLIHRYAALETGIDYRLASFAFRRGDSSQLAWQSHLTLRLQTREDKAVLVSVSANNLGKTRTFTRVTDTTVTGSGGSANQPQVTEQFRETDTSWTFGLQYARRFGPINLRGGLIESTAGAGFDFYLFHDALVASADVFRFNDDSRPRVRAGVIWRFLPYLYAWVGGDELAFPTTRMDLFYGGGVSFTDNDLKILFAASPSLPK